jgi:hypothetical protein
MEMVRIEAEQAAAAAVAVAKTDRLAAEAAAEQLRLETEENEKVLIEATQITAKIAGATEQPSESTVGDSATKNDSATNEDDSEIRRAADAAFDNLMRVEALRKESEEAAAIVAVRRKKAAEENARIEAELEKRLARELQEKKAQEELEVAKATAARESQAVMFPHMAEYFADMQRAEEKQRQDEVEAQQAAAEAAKEPPKLSSPPLLIKLTFETSEDKIKALQKGWELEIIDTAILERSPEAKKSKKYVTYSIAVKCAMAGGGFTKGWQVTKRYSEFSALHKKMLKATPLAKSLKLAPKRRFKSNLDPSFIAFRKEKLQQYLDALGLIEALAFHPATIEFLLVSGDGTPAFLDGPDEDED